MTHLEWGVGDNCFIIGSKLFKDDEANGLHKLGPTWKTTVISGQIQAKVTRKWAVKWNINGQSISKNLSGCVLEKSSEDCLPKPKQNTPLELLYLQTNQDQESTII